MKTPYWLWICVSLATVSAIPASAYQPPELKNPLFKEGRPVEGEALESAIRSQADLDNLVDSASFLARNKSVEFSILGFADRAECGGENCSVLALRRARLIFNYLIDAKIDPKRLRQLGEYGADRYLAVDPGETFKNQRVEIQLSFDRLNEPLR